jgi:hypothetical protein
MNGRISSYHPALGLFWLLVVGLVPACPSPTFAEPATSLASNHLKSRRPGRLEIETAGEESSRHSSALENSGDLGDKKAPPKIIPASDTSVFRQAISA